MNQKKSLRRVLMGLLALGLVLAVSASIPNSSFSVSLAAKSAPDGCSGTVKIHSEPGEPSPVTQDETKVCLFHVHGFDFDPGSSVTWWIETQPGGVQVAGDTAIIGEDGSFVTAPIDLGVGQYKLYWHQEGCPGGEKHKVFRVVCDGELPPA